MSVITQTAKFNELEHDVKIYLDNGAGESDAGKFQINPNAIVNLNIEDTLADWVVRGNITLYYAFEVFENKPANTTVVGAAGNLNQPPRPYVFRNDGNDLLCINIFPRLDKVGLSLNKKHWELVYRFSIYDMEDIDLPPGAQNASSVAIKCKKLYFWDQWYQRMITNTMEYSTAYSESQYNGIRTALPTSIPDRLRSIPTGIAMKEIIEKALGEDINLNLSYGSTSLVGGPGNEDWETGATNIFYTAPAANNAYDTLMDVYDRHVSEVQSNESVNDFSILYKERGPNDGDLGYFSLKPVSKFFENAGKSSPKNYQTEHFFVQDYITKTGPSNNTSSVGARRSPLLTSQNMEVDTKLANYSLITSYRFVDISALTNATKFRTKAVHSIDLKNRTFNIEYKQNTVGSARKVMTDKYISQVLTSNDNDDSLFLITLEKTKKSQNIEPVFSLYGNRDDYDDGKDLIARQADGLQKLLHTGLFQNSCLHFRCLGSTNREPGRFIAIDKAEGIEDNTFNNKFYGQWFVINVRHMFEAGLYYNEIVAVKVHRFKALEQGFTFTYSEGQTVDQSPVITPPLNIIQPPLG